MTSQTARRPNSPRPTRSAKARKYTRQTAHVEARRDGKPLIFGWGGHLSRTEKVRLQRRIIWAMTTLTALLIVAVIIGFWVNLNIVVPAKAITTVNGESIPQSNYRKYFALDAQFEANHVYGPTGLNTQRDNLNKQVADAQKVIDTLNTQIKALPAGKSTQRTNLEKQLASAQSNHDNLNAQYQNMLQSVIPNEMQLFTQSQYGNDAVSTLQDDVFIRQWLAKQNSTVAGRVQPSSSAVDQAINSFSANLPKATNYNKFLSDNSLSNDDAHAMMAVLLRRVNMQSYLSSLIVPPLYQVHARDMTLNTKALANTILKQLKNNGDFAKIAKAQSVDATTKTSGGDLGWLAQGQYAQNIASNTSGIVDNWIFDHSRTPNEISDVITENGAYHIIQILQIDPARPVDATTLGTLQRNALTSWLLAQKGKLNLSVLPSDQTMLLDPMNIPNTTPSLPASPPATATPATTAGGTTPGGTGTTPGGTTTGTGTTP
ncbi:MAG: peptidylprolyl isomerase [Ktedonobacteraceae bacterium]|nr:peptidylprolyl isomerase [Ktedonobacteraceae bacterium]